MIKIGLRVALVIGIMLSVQPGTYTHCLAQSDGKAKDEARRVYDQQKKFSIVPPTGWDTDGQSKSPTTILSRKSDAKDLFGNFIVKKNKLPDGQSVADAAKKSIEASKPQLSDFEMIEEGDVKINGREAYFAFFKATRNSMKVIAGFYFVKGESTDVYVMNYTILPLGFERLKPELKKAAASIRISP